MQDRCNQNIHQPASKGFHRAAPSLIQAQQVPDADSHEEASQKVTRDGFVRMSNRMVTVAIKGLQSKSLKQRKLDLAWLNGADSPVPVMIACFFMDVSHRDLQRAIVEKHPNLLGYSTKTGLFFLGPML